MSEASERIRGQLECLQTARAKLWDNLNSGIYAQLTEQIQQIQHVRHSKKWKLYLGKRTVLCALRERRFCKLVRSAAQRNFKEVEASLIREDWLRPAKKTLEDGMRVLIQSTASVQQLVEAQQTAILNLIDVYHDEGKKAIVVMAPYFTQERLADGYFQRVQAVDRMMPPESLKIYASWLDADDVRGIPLVYIWDETHIEIRYPHPDTANDERMHRIARKAGIVYHHSITFANEVVTRDGTILKAFDMHGAYPEELRMYGREEQAILDEQQERLAMEYGQCLICVTHSMVRHLKKKYSRVPEKIILLPIFDEGKLQQCRNLKKTSNTQDVVVYAGGMQKWQNVEMMQDAVRRTEGQLQYRFFTPKPHVFWKTWGKRRRPYNIEVCSMTPDEVIAAYASCDYGFLLRDDSVVNKVACPTKLVEYMAARILPILHTPDIGDFVQDGMAYISLANFLLGKLPDEAEKNRCIEQNVALVRKLEERYHQGKKALCIWLEQNEKREGENK